MTPHPTAEDNDLSATLLNKADALIRRNRPDGVGSDAEELPLLTEVVDDLPELTETLVFGPAGVEVREERSADLPFDIGYGADSQTPVASTRPSLAGGSSFGRVEAPPPPRAAEPTHISREQVDILIDDAIQRTRDELLRKQGDMIHEAVEKVRAEALAAQAHAVQAALAQARQDREHAVQDAVDAARAEARAMQTRAVQAALTQGRDEAMSGQQTYIEDVRREAAEAASMQMSEHLIQLDAFIAQAVDGWMARELPQIISGELDSLVERLKTQAAAHMRATLLPEISDRLSLLLDAALTRRQ